MVSPRSGYMSDSSLEKLEASIPKSIARQFPRKPTLRIGFMEGYEKIDFRVSGKFSIKDLEGDPIFSGVSSRLKWRALLEGAHGATFIYSLLVTACRDESEATAVIERLRRLYPQVRTGEPVLPAFRPAAGRTLGDSTRGGGRYGHRHRYALCAELQAQRGELREPAQARARQREGRAVPAVRDEQPAHRLREADGLADE